ncbi:MAG: N-acetyltransferase [Anaerolineales bacterium]|nr:N-acetyltransferase [Anaerolineales bacterium]
MKIFRLTPNDFEQFYALRLESLEKCPEEFATDAEAWKNASRETINNLLFASEERQDAPIFGAWKDDALIGMIGANRNLRPTVRHKSTLWGLYVTSAYRRQGVGGALLEEVVKVMKGEPELRLIRAVVTVTSRDAISLLEKKGFQVYGQEPEAKRLEDTYYDQVYMWLPLR